MLYLARDSEFLSCYTGAIANDRLDDAHQMVEDGLLLGLSADDLAALLGPPSGGKTFIGFDQGYYLRPDGICIDSEWLAVRFDGEGRVETAEIYFD